MPIPDFECLKELLLFRSHKNYRMDGSYGKAAVMHSYLRAVGFSNVKNRQDLDKIIGIVMNRPTEVYKVRTDEKTVLTEMRMDFSPGMGVSVLGEYDEKGFFHLLHYFPYLKGTTYSLEESMAINKRVDSDTYTGMCDDIRLGISLIFYLQNVVQYVEMRQKGYIPEERIPVYLSALSTEGKILLGIAYDEEKHNKQWEENQKKTELIKEAKKGDPSAINTLTLEDIDLCEVIAKRSLSEDVYSIVENTFIPYGSESDNYSVLGTIKEYSSVTNVFSGESVCILKVDCNDMLFDICINAKDLKGEPAKGRRFKGNVWMQGMIDFKS